MGYSVGSLFAGIGGICKGFEQAGYKLVWANEWDNKACQTYKHNFPNNTLYPEDIHNLTKPSVLKTIKPVDIITSGFPCQAFSVAGYRKGFNDHRGNLFFETAKFIESQSPKAFLLENVKNLVGHDKGETFRIIQKTIEEDLGYSFIPFILNSKEYGNIPQTRERIYIVGFKSESPDNKDRICTDNFKPLEKIDLKKGIRDLLDSDQKAPNFYYDKGHQYYDQLSEVMKSRETVYQWRRVYVRENKSNVCPTLTANMGTGGHNVPLIIDDYGIRKLTPKECINFQGFPNSFSFPEGMANSHCYKQAGNSVVVPVVKRIATEMKRVLDIKYSDNDISKKVVSEKTEASIATS